MGVNTTNKEFDKKLKSFTPSAEAMPGIVIIHQLEPFKCDYMNEAGLERLGISLEELKKIGAGYHNGFLNFDDAEDFLHRIKAIIDLRSLKESFTFLQQVKLKDREDWVWHVGSTRIFFKNVQGKVTHMVTIAIPIDELKHIPNKAKRMLAEGEFLRNNIGKFLCLTSREREILQLVAIGKSSGEIAKQLYLSPETVNSHRKNIKSKLGISTTFDFTQYAQAFDLM